MKAGPRAACGTAHQDFHLQDLSIFLLEEVGNQVEIAIVDPGFQKSRRYG
jgi:hypothetical protein